MENSKIKRDVQGNIILDTVLIDITTRCPHQCIFCFHHYYKISKNLDIKSENFYKIIDILKKEGVKGIITYLSGESFCHSYIYDFLEYIADKELDCYIASKFGVNLDFKRFRNIMDKYKYKNKKVDITIEVDSINKETFTKIVKTGNFDLIWQNIKKLKEFYSYPNIKMRFTTIVNKYNENELEDINKKLQSLGFKTWNYKLMGLFMLYEKKVNLKELEQFLPINPKYKQRINIENGKVVTQRDICLSHRPAISPTGEVLMCCHDMLHKISAGNILVTNSIRKIINSKKYKKLLNLAFNKKLIICKGCN